MGGGTFDETSYLTARATRAANRVDDFQYSKTAVRIHESLDPKRIHTKPFQLLESRDSVEHSTSTPVILTFDVTGSNIRNARIVQQHLPQLMAQLQAVLANPQIAIWANDDVNYVSTNSIQLGEFESDNRIDEAIRNIWLTSEGGGNQGESYDLLLYAAARKVVTDSWEKRHKRGYLFLYADEPFFDQVSAKDVRTVFDDNIQGNIPIAEMIAEVIQRWDTWILWPASGYRNSRDQYIRLFGESRVETVQDPAMIGDKVAALISARETELAEISQQAMAHSAGELAPRVD